MTHKESSNRPLTELQQRVLAEIHIPRETVTDFQSRLIRVVDALLGSSAHDEYALVDLAEAIAPAVSPTAPRDSMRGLLGGTQEEGEKAVALLAEVQRRLEAYRGNDEMVLAILHNVRARVDSAFAMDGRLPGVLHGAVQGNIADAQFKQPERRRRVG